MQSIDERIQQFTKMTQEDPDNELGHYRLGQLFAEAVRHDEAIRSFRRTLELSPQFSKVYQLLGESQVALGRRDEAIATWKEGHKVADERGDRIPRDAIAMLLVKNGEAPPVVERPEIDGPETGFRCSRPMCLAGKKAQPLTIAPLADEIGQTIAARVCQECWTSWVKDYSIKVINELRLDLSDEKASSEYDRHMREYLGIE
ncbi:MAG: tetratricopeptide repeat protein [Gemmataceae bacterium]|jgi:tetratricopeptide (TPR) repeat protein